MGTLQDELKKLYPKRPSAKQPTHPPYSNLDIPQSYQKFCADMAGRDFTDPRNTQISVLDVNFPKLLGAKMAATGAKAKASLVLASLKNGTFNPALYEVEDDRIDTLFWIEDTICKCDSIHDNNHPVIEADEVYVKRYDKIGSQVKLVFTRKLDAGQIVIVTSFLTSPADLVRFVKMPPIWP
ncbi:MAG TPA: hypothetical protein VN966_00150 [Candidatus Bathyarchaeia archaeon]|nr:hypothetical protein [Candidatus Bathyarchaeia archaeon]